MPQSPMGFRVSEYPDFQSSTMLPCLNSKPCRARTQGRLSFLFFLGFRLPYNTLYTKKGTPFIPRLLLGLIGLRIFNLFDGFC